MNTFFLYYLANIIKVKAGIKLRFYHNYYCRHEIENILLL